MRLPIAAATASSMAAVARWSRSLSLLTWKVGWLKPAFAGTPIASDLMYSTAADYARSLMQVMKNEGITQAVATERARIQVGLRDRMCQSAQSDVSPDELGPALQNQNGAHAHRAGPGSLHLRLAMPHNGLRRGHPDEWSEREQTRNPPPQESRGGV